MKTTEERYCRYYHALYHVAATINSSLDPGAVLQAIVQNIAEAMGVKGCSIMLLSPDRKELRHSAHYGLSERYVKKGPVSVDLSMSEALAGRSVAVPDAVSDNRVQYGPQNAEEGIASILSVPMRLKGEIIGVIRVYTGAPLDFSDEDTEFLDAAGHLGAIALENARRHDELQYNYDMITRYIYSDTWVGQLWSTEKTA
jgi:GAF domain-containing protein